MPKPPARIPGPFCERCGEEILTYPIFHHGQTVCHQCLEVLTREARKPSLIDKQYAAEMRRHKLGN